MLTVLERSRGNGWKRQLVQLYSSGSTGLLVESEDLVDTVLSFETYGFGGFFVSVSRVLLPWTDGGGDQGLGIPARRYGN